MKIIRTRKTYTSCDNLPLSNFINIVVDGDLSQLYAEPARFIHKQSDLSSIWENIFNEYNELTNNTQSRHIFNLIKEIKYIDGKNKTVSECISLLSQVNDVNEYQETIDILNSFGCSHIKITNENKFTTLPRCETVCKRFIIELNQKEAEYQSLNSDDNNKATKQDFYETISYISEHLHGKTIDVHKTTVSMYVADLNLIKNKLTKSN